MCLCVIFHTVIFMLQVAVSVTVSTLNSLLCFCQRCEVQEKDSEGETS